MTSTERSRLEALLEEWKALVNDSRYHPMFRSGVGRCIFDLEVILKQTPEDTTPSSSMRSI